MAGSPTALSTGELTPQSLLIFTGHAFLNAVTIQPGATVTIYDNTSAAGKVIFQYVNAGTNTESVVFRNAIRADIGLFVVVAAADAQVYWGAT